MSYTESGEMYTFFDDRENNLIEQWLKDHGYTWGKNTVCGNCCGMYDEEYWVNGIGGHFKKADQVEFAQFIKGNDIGAKVSGYTISAYSE